MKSEANDKKVQMNRSEKDDLSELVDRYSGRTE